MESLGNPTANRRSPGEYGLGATDVPRGGPLQEKASKKHFLLVKKEISNDWKDLGRLLTLDDADLENLHREYTHQEGIRETAYMMLLQWSRQCSPATVECLLNALIAVGRKDIADKLLEIQPGHGRELGFIVPYQDTLSQMTQCLKRRYRALTMKGLPWMSDVELHLDRYYIEVDMNAFDMKNGEIYNEQTLSTKDIFKPCDGEQRVPTRIFLHGRPGSGKSVVASKLAYDWARCGIDNTFFNIVVILSAVDCDGESFDKVITKAVGMPHLDDAEILNIIQSPSTNVLLIIDDYERITAKAESQLLPIIREEQLSHVTVVVMSRSRKLCSNAVHNSLRSSGTDTTRFLHRHVTLLGLSDEQKNLFVQNHLHDIPERDTISQKVEDIISLWSAHAPDFEISPLDLLLLIMALTDLPDGEVSLTKIHKYIFTLKVKRYMSKTGACQATNLDLLDFCESTPADCVNALRQFGKFANRVLSTGNFSFSDEEIRSTVDGQTILDLGFVSEVTNVEGIKQKVLYYPINRSLFEFSTAHFFGAMFKDLPIAKWDRETKDLFFSLRPRLVTTSPLWFSFLVGLLQDSQAELFKSFTPFASEYSHYFGSLCYSLLETSVSETSEIETLQKCILPMMPVLWRIPWKSNDEFSNSPHHTELLRYGLESGKIKIIRWNAKQAVYKSSDLKVDRLMLDLQEPIDKWATWECNLSCNELHCLISGEFGNTAEANWEEFLERIFSTTFKCLSFEIKAESSLDWLPLICEEAINGRLRETDIQWVLCDLHKQRGQLIQDLIHLVSNNRVKGLQLALCGQHMGKNSFPDNSTALQSSGRQGDAANGQIGKLVEAAAKSQPLKRLVIINREELITIDLANLCDEGKKSWKWVQLIGVRVEYTSNPGNPKLKIQSLDLSNAVISESAAKNLMNYKVKSLASSMKLLTCGTKTSAILKSLKGLDVKVDQCVYDETLPPKLQNLEKLQILAVSLAPLDGNREPIPLRKWIMGTHNFLPLKGFEIWGVEVNLQLATNLIKSILESVTGSQPLVEIQQLRRSSALPPLQLKLKYLLVSLGLVNDSSQNKELLIKLVKLISLLKPILKDKLLPHLEIVCADEVVLEMSRVKPNGMISWVDVFPSQDGFHVTHDFWGMSVEGPFRSREVFKSCPGEFNRFCITMGEEVVRE